MLIAFASLANLHKRPETVARYNVTSYWQAEWVKKREWKTIELPPPPLPPPPPMDDIAVLSKIQLVV